MGYHFSDPPKISIVITNFQKNVFLFLDAHVKRGEVGVVFEVMMS